MIDGIFAANATQEIPATTVSQFSGIPVHPGEDAAAKQEDDWWRIFNSVVSNQSIEPVCRPECPQPVYRTTHAWDFWRVVVIVAPALSRLLCELLHFSPALFTISYMDGRSR